MYILVYMAQNQYAITFEKKEEAEEFLNNNRWVMNNSPKLFCGSKYRIEELEVASYVIEKKLRILP